MGATDKKSDDAATLTESELEELNTLRAEKKEREAEAAAKAAANGEEPEDEYYLILGNGDRVKVKESEVPGYAGTNARFGFWTVDGNVHTITDVVPAERKASK